MSKSLSVKGLVAHCQEHGSDPINNTAWNTCAIGTYLDSRGYSIRHDRGELYTLVPLAQQDDVEKFYCELRDTFTGELNPSYGEREEQDEYLSLASYLNDGLAQSYKDVVEAVYNG